jgi:hypothetical protein
MGGTCGMHGVGEKVYIVLAGEPDRTRKLDRHQRIREDNIGMVRKEVVWEGVD